MEFAKEELALTGLVCIASSTMLNITECLIFCMRINFTLLRMHETAPHYPEAYLRADRARIPYVKL